MINGRKVVVVLPAYNAEKTLEQTYREVPLDIVDEVILVDDHSGDETLEVAQRLDLTHVLRHESNLGYGANQKTCYDAALKLGADIVVMLHPDYQYTPKLISAMAALIAHDVYPVVLGSRILGGSAVAGGMPRYKYLANRVLTLIQNLMLGQKLSEYHTGYRAFSAEVLRAVPYHENSDDFIFDNEIIAQIFARGYRIGEVSCPTRYFEDASSIRLLPSIRYGLGVLRVSLEYFLKRITRSKLD